MTYSVVLLSRAETELTEIAVWLSERSPDGAVRWLDAFDAARKSLSENPSRCGLAPEDELVDEEIRHILFQARRGQAYRAIFTIVGDEVRVLHIRGPRDHRLTDVSGKVVKQVFA